MKSFLLIQSIKSFTVSKKVLLSSFSLLSSSMTSRCSSESFSGISTSTLMNRSPVLRPLLEGIPLSLTLSTWPGCVPLGMSTWISESGVGTVICVPSDASPTPIFAVVNRSLSRLSSESCGSTVTLIIRSPGLPFDSFSFACDFQSLSILNS